MKFVVGMDSFKGGLSAAEACRAVGEGLRSALPEAMVVEKPMADGGEGTAAALLAARADGRWIPVRARGPLAERTVGAGFAWFEDERLAVVEMAAVNGLPLLGEDGRDPLAATTLGTGELIRAALDRGARRILLALGGSATSDGGAGAAHALGWRFFDRSGESILPRGGNLGEIVRIEAPSAGVPTVPVSVLCDVTNPLYGRDGAAFVYGPQKGATPEMVEWLDEGLRHLARILSEQHGVDVSGLPGGGAAGGLGAGAVAFLGAKLEPGIDAIVRANGLAHALVGADWCLTGEGSFDLQSLSGKVVAGVARAAGDVGVPTVVLAGRIRVGPADYRSFGIREARATHADSMPVDEVIRREGELIRETAAQWARSI